MSPSEPHPEPPTVDPARRAAADLLEAVRIEDAYANVVWPSILERWGITGRDAAFATDLAYGTLRWRGLYDAVIERCASRPAEQIDPLILDVLRLGSHQLLGMRVPDHAAVDSSCGLARARGVTDSGRVGFINAVLRKVARKDLSQWQSAASEQATGDSAVAISTSHPLWIVQSIREALATHINDVVSDDQLREALMADNIPAKPTLALRAAVAEDLLEGTIPGRWTEQARVLDTTVPARSVLVRHSQAIVQDEGSQLAVRALLAAPVDPPESAWLDMCAGPGGKAALLADAAQVSGIDLLAVELHSHRGELVRRTVGNRVPIEIQTGDATTRPWGNRFFDRILVDAPCTGLGALRRRPEARWRRLPDDLRTLTPTQHALLDAGLSSLRRGGVLAYVTCSPHVRETRDVIDDVLIARDGFREEDTREVLSDIPDTGPGPHVQLWPHIHGTDAMFIALVRRV